MESGSVLDSVFPSQTEYVETALARASVFLDSLEEAEKDRGLLVLRELLLNAVVHGNMNNREKVSIRRSWLGAPGNVLNLGADLC